MLDEGPVALKAGRSETAPALSAARSPWACGKSAPGASPAEAAEREGEFGTRRAFRRAVGDSTRNGRDRFGVARRC
jgi:hypothetical protein